MQQPLVIRTPNPGETTVLNPEVLDGAGVVLVPPGVERVQFLSLPDRPNQCGRTFIHGRHETTEGWCAGLDGTEVSRADASADYASPAIPPGLEDTDPDAIRDLLNAAARWGQLGVLRVARSLYSPAAWAAALSPGQPADEAVDPAPEPETDPWAIPVPYATLETGLRLIEDAAGGRCDRHVAALGACFKNGRTADSPYGATAACAPCIAHAALTGDRLPAGDPDQARESHDG
jgi:hypothetical protein